MSEDSAQESVRGRSGWRWPRRLLAIVLLLVALVGVSLIVLDTAPGHRLIAARINALTPSNGLRYSVGRIEGSVYGKARLIDVRVSDPRGVFFMAPVADLDWRPVAWSINTLDIRSLHIPLAGWVRLPKTLPTGSKNPILPGFDIKVGSLVVDHLMVGRALVGQRRMGRLAGRADIHDRRALVDLGLRIAGSDAIDLHLDTAPDRDVFDVDLRARGPADGLLAHLSGLRRPIALSVTGDGSWQRWQGRAVAGAGGDQLADLALINRSGDFQLKGMLAPAPLLKGKLQTLTRPRIAVDAAGTLADRQLDGRFTLRSPVISVDGEGGIDLRNNGYRNLRLVARLLKPEQLVSDMTGKAVELRVVLDGGFADGRFDYRLTADRVTFGKTGIERIAAGGAGRFTKVPVRIPLRFTAARVTGVGDVAGGILRNLLVNGVLQASSTTLIGNDLAFSSDKLKGKLTLLVDLRTGRYEIGLNGGLNRYLIPGLGIVDVSSKLSIIPGPNGRGTRIVGTGSAQVVRLDNAFFRSLTGGLPHIDTLLERTTDGVIHFTRLRLTSPQLRLTGTAYRRKDGSFHFEGGGDQTKYGPLTLLLDGRIERPALTLRFARPNDTLGLKDVDAKLTPTAAGYDFVAAGQSRLGPFTGDGAILLPRGGQSAVRIDRLDVSGTRANGLLNIVDGGFAGDIAFTGGGLAGTLTFAPKGTVQGIDGTITAESARIGDGYAIRRGRMTFNMLLDPAGTTIGAEVRALGLSSGSIRIGRLNASARLNGGNGTIRAAISGSRGRAFDIETVTTVQDGAYSVTGQGMVDRKPVRLAGPAVIRFVDGKVQLDPSRIEFGGGNATLSGSFGSDETVLDARLSGLPLTLLDIAYPGLGLGGTASGTLSFADRPGARETARIDMKVRGLSRSGLALSSRPVDVAVAGVLQNGRAAARGIAANGGKTVGRGQIRIDTGGGGSLTDRLNNGSMFAQLRYDGAADTLWRLTGVELIDLTGNVAIGADMTGRLSQPQIRGSLRTNNARLESTVTGTVLTGVQASGSFTGSKLVLDRFSGRDGKGGSVTGSGTFNLSSASGFGIDLSLQAQDAVLIDRDDIGATVTGPITIKSTGSGGVIGGDVRLTAARYRLGQAAAATPLPRINIREINQPITGDEDDRPPTPWRLDLTARTNNLSVTGLGLSSVWGGTMVIKGEPTDPAISGDVKLVRGDYEFAGREFELQRGVIRFDGGRPANPSLDIAAEADADNLTATINVRGTAEKPEISFASVPALPQDELLSRLLFGTSITNLSAPEALQLAAAVSALQSGGGGLDPINAVRSAVGLDRLRILPADPTTGQQTAVAAGKYITRRAYVEIITDGQGYSATRLEYRVTRWLSLLSSISTIGRQSANVRVSKDY